MPQSRSASSVMIFATSLILISDWLIRSLPCDWSNTGRLLRFCMLLIPLSEVFRQSWAAYTSIVFVNWFGISMIGTIFNANSSWDSSFTGLGFGWASGWCLRRIWRPAVNIWPITMLMLMLDHPFCTDKFVSMFFHLHRRNSDHWCVNSHRLILAVLVEFQLPQYTVLIWLFNDIGAANELLSLLSPFRPNE